MYAPTAAIGGIIYVGGASDYSGGTVIDTTNSFSFNPGTNTIGSIAAIPRATGETRGLTFNGKMYVMGGGRVAPNPSTEVDVYNPGTNSWTTDVPFVTPRRNFPTDTNGTNHIWLAGGYASDGITPLNTMEIFGQCVSPSPTPTATGTPSASPSCTPSAFHVLIVYADTTTPTQLQSEIMAEPGVTAVDLFDAQAGTPTLAQLQQYNIVVPYSNFPFLDADTLGNNLADYVDGGGVVVQYGFSHYGPGQPYGINGRWASGNYNPYNYSTNLEFNSFSLGTFNAGHPLMAGVTMLNSNFLNVVTLAAGATEVAADNLGESLVAFRPVGGHTTVGVTAYVGSDATQSGDWGKVIVNAGRWLIAGPCGTPSPTPTATATATGSPSCTPSAWQNAANMPTDLYGAAGASDGTNFYAAGGYSFSSGLTLAVVNRYNPGSNTWTPMAAHAAGSRSWGRRCIIRRRTRSTCLAVKMRHSGRTITPRRSTILRLTPGPWARPCPMCTASPRAGTLGPPGRSTSSAGITVGR